MLEIAFSVTLSVVRLDIVGAAGAVWLTLVTVSSAEPVLLIRPLPEVPATPPKSAVMVLAVSLGFQFSLFSVISSVAV